MSDWTILYRGPLVSCNYGCGYCPFAKRANTREELEDDAAKLRRFAGWVVEQAEEMELLFTPWGEALHHRVYQDALVDLSHAHNVARVAIQTNLSARLDKLREANPEKLAIWATWHPSEVSMERFLEQCARLGAMQIPFSVGMVGKREHFEAIQRMRSALPGEVYLWVNAYKDEPDYYQSEEILLLEELDPYFRINLQNYPSRGLPCTAGSKAFSVDGDGEIRQCHFIPERLGNIYAADFRSAFQERVCTKTSCDCFIGHMHLPQLDFQRIYGSGRVARIPAQWSKP